MTKHKRSDFVIRPCFGLLASGFGFQAIRVHPRPSAVSVLLLALLLSACAAPQPATRPSHSADDPCATQLHEISGALLLYYSRHHNLPVHLADLQSIGESADSLICPITHQPYAYDSAGVPISESSRVFVYDATPHPNGKRWAIALAQPQSNKPLEATIIPLPREFQPSPASPAP